METNAPFKVFLIFSYFSSKRLVCQYWIDLKRNALKWKRIAGFD